MLIECRTDKWGGVAPLIAGKGNGSPLDNCKGGRKVTASKNGAVCFIGYVSMVDEDFDRDGATIEALDVRWLLEGGNIVGSFWIEDEGSSVCYRQSEPAWFNKNGLPNRFC